MLNKTQSDFFNSHVEFDRDSMFKQIESELNETLKSDIEFASLNGTDEFKSKTSFMQKIYLFIFSRLVGHLEVEITARWNGSVIFNYVIPKNSKK